MKRYVLFHRKRHPKEMAEAEVNAFLTHLAADRNVSASLCFSPLGPPKGTVNQALSALLSLYRSVLGKELSQ